MSNYVIIENEIGAPSPVSQADSVQRWPLGYEAKGYDLGLHSTGTVSNVPSLGAGVFVYCQGSDVGTAGLVVKMVSNSAVKLAAAAAEPVGVACAALSATNVYGWVQVAGVLDYARGTNVSIPANAALFVGTAGGFLVSGSVANSRIMGLVAPASYTSSQSLSMSLQLARPYCQFNTGSM